MQHLLMQLIAERGPIRLAIEVAIALGAVAVAASWAAEAIRERRRRRAAAEEALSAVEPRVAA